MGPVSTYMDALKHEVHIIDHTMVYMIHTVNVTFLQKLFTKSESIQNAHLTSI